MMQILVKFMENLDVVIRENAIRLQEKERREKELLNQIIEEADEYKLEFYQKRKIACENNKASNRENEKVRMIFYVTFGCVCL